MKTSTLLPGSRVWIVARHSPGKGQSIDSQMAALLDYCKVNRLEIVDQFIDAGASGSNRNREEFVRMREAAEASPRNRVDGIVFYDSSRFARDFADAQYTKAMLRRKGYVLEWILGEQYEGLPGAIMETVEDYHNEEFLRRISEKSKTGLRTMIQLRDETGAYYGFWPGKVPYGYRAIERELPVINTVTGKPRVKQCLEPDYDAWSLGRKVFELIAGGLTRREVEESTNFFGRRGTVDVENGNSIASSYRNFVRNKIYKGVFEFQELELKNYIEPMVSDELWQAANNSSWRYKRGNWIGYQHGKAGKVKHPFVLAGLCECGQCAAPYYTHITSRKRKRHRYYKCKTRKLYGAAACDNPHVRADILEGTVMTHALGHYCDPELVETVYEQIDIILNDAPSQAAQIEQARREVDQISHKLYNLADAIAVMGATEEIGTRLAELKAEKRAAVSALARMREMQLPEYMDVSLGEVQRAMLQLSDRLQSTGESKSALRQIIRKIKIELNSIEVFYRNPLCLSGNSRWETFDFYQLGYVIQLPLKV